MQQIVVGNEQDGKAAISYLKRTGGGRATFLPLSTVQGRILQENGLDRCRGYVGIASELVSCQDQYRGIVDNLLGRTVIAENIDAAIVMANQYRNRFKIVTLDGQVMNPGGSMTGGSVNKEAGILSRANELEKLAAQQQDLEQKKTVLQGDLQEAQRQVDQVEFQLNTAREQLREVEDQSLRLQGREKQYEILLAAVEDACSAALKEKETLIQRRNSDRERFAAQQAKIQVYTAQLDETKAELARLEGSQIEAAQATQSITERMTAVKSEEAALNAERVTALAHIEDLQTLQNAMAGDREKQLLLIRTMEEETERLLSQIDALKTRQSENDAQVGAERTKMQQILSDRAEAEASKTRAEREAQEKNKDILNMERACALLEQKKITTAMEERQIVDKLWDSYNLTPGTAGEHRLEIESVAAGNRRIAELKRKITSLGTPNLGAIEEYARVNERSGILRLNSISISLNTSSPNLREAMPVMISTLR